MAVQGNYTENLRVGVAGQQVNMIPSTMISRNVEGAGGLAFGVAVARGVEDYGCKPFGSGDTAILGISVRERSVNANVPNKFGQYDSARIMTKGAIWVQASVAVDAGDPVFVIPATGAFTKSNASSAVQLLRAHWDTSTIGAGLAIVRMD